MDAVYIAAAIPVFLVAIFVEVLIARRRGVSVYAYHDSISNLSGGMGQLLFGALLPFFSYGIYFLGYEHLRVATLSISSPLVWFLCVVGVDVGYYAFHRASHRVNFMWAVHAVHHQSEEYNYSVALRQAWLEPMLAGPFHFPLAILGFPPGMIIACVTLNTLYQFWVHTRLVGRLGPLELLFNTPSHHRVHHGRNPKYIDRNYSGMFIVWDRLFGTFQVEEEEPAYGVVKAFRSKNPLWANLEVWVRLAGLSRRGAGVKERLLAFFGPPEWLPQAEGGRAAIPEPPPCGGSRWDVETSRGVDVYVGAQLALLTLLIAGFLLIQDKLVAIELVTVTVWFVASMVGSSGLVEGRRYAVPIEIARLVTLPMIAMWLTRVVPISKANVTMIAVTISVVSAAGLAVVASSRQVEKSRA